MWVYKWMHKTVFFNIFWMKMCVQNDHTTWKYMYKCMRFHFSCLNENTCMNASYSTCFEWECMDECIRFYFSFFFEWECMDECFRFYENTCANAWEIFFFNKNTCTNAWDSILIFLMLTWNACANENECMRPTIFFFYFFMLLFLCILFMLTFRVNCSLSHRWIHLTSKFCFWI